MKLRPLKHDRFADGTPVVYADEPKADKDDELLRRERQVARLNAEWKAGVEADLLAEKLLTRALIKYLEIDTESAHWGKCLTGNLNKE